jgi:hypothetical protein
MAAAAAVYAIVLVYRQRGTAESTLFEPPQYSGFWEQTDDNKNLQFEWVNKRGGPAVAISVRYTAIEGALPIVLETGFLGYATVPVGESFPMKLAFSKMDAARVVTVSCRTRWGSCVVRRFLLHVAMNELAPGTGQPPPIDTFPLYWAMTPLADHVAAEVASQATQQLDRTPRLSEHPSTSKRADEGWLTLLAPAPR